MQRGRRRAGLLIATSTIAFASPAEAGETVTYTYDALGRLTATSTTGTVNNGVATSIAYDPAGNRSSYAVAGAAGGTPPPVTPPPPPPPPPPPANNPPTALNDSGTQPKCSTAAYDVLVNDSDVDGDYPLALVSVSGTGFTLDSPTRIQFASGSTTGSKTGTYVVRDSRGATAGATLNINVSGGVCGPLPAPPPTGETGS